VYSLCVVLYELLTLKHYLAACSSTQEVLDGVVKTEPVYLGIERNPAQPTVPMDLLWFARKGLQKDKRRRYQTVREMIERLDARAEGVIPIQCHVTATMRFTRALGKLGSRHPVALLVGYALAVIAAVVGLVGWASG